MSDSIVKLVSKPITKPATKSKSKKQIQRISQHNFSCYAAIGTMFSLAALSLTHLAKGISILTSSPMWESIAMAIGTDFGFVSVELAMVTALNRKNIEKWARPTLWGLLLWSAFLNAFAFSAQSSGWMQYVAAGLGLSIPALMFSLTRIGSTMWIDAQPKN